jgi:hypothetical protein
VKERKNKKIGKNVFDILTAKTEWNTEKAQLKQDVRARDCFPHL